jgi:hypothetical protein
MEEIIKRAIEGGYDNEMGLFNLPDYSPYDKRLIYAVLTNDPDYFKALGKACGWEKMVGEDIKLYKQDFADILEHRILSSGWIVYSLRFHEINLTKGWEKAVEYLKSIVVK